MTPTTSGSSSGMKVMLGSGASLFLISAVFWAGATYNRVQGIEAHLLNIDAAVSKIGDIQAIAERTNETQRRLDRIEQSLFKIETDKKFGNR